MKRFLLAVVTAALVSGCSAVNVGAQSVDPVVLNKGAYAARATYVGSLIVMAQIVKLPRCEKAPAPCVPQAAVDSMRTGELVADKATQAAEDAARNAGTDPTVMSLLVANATKAAGVFKFATDTYAPAPAAK